MKLLSCLAAIFTLFSCAAAAPSTCNVLALSGGGAFGAVEMGMLDGLTEAGQAPSR